MNAFSNNFIAIIPARSGSKGIKNKNLRKINGIPLINYTIEAAKRSKFIKKIFVSTDGKKIADYCKKKKIEVIKRPKSLSSDFATSDRVVYHAINYLIMQKKISFENIVFLQATSAARKKQDIDNAIKKFKRKKLDSLFSGVNLHPFCWKKTKKNISSMNFSYMKRKRRQDSIFETIIENGSFYITKKKIWLKNKNRFGGKIDFYLMDSNSVFEIDSISDLNLVSHMFKFNYYKKTNIIVPK